MVTKQAEQLTSSKHLDRASDRLATVRLLCFVPSIILIKEKYLVSIYRLLRDIVGVFMGGLMTDGCRPCVVIWAVFLLSSVMGYRPVIIVHGILDGPRQFETLAKFINQVRSSYLFNIIFIRHF